MLCLLVPLVFIIGLIPSMAVECPICRMQGRHISYPNKMVDTSGGTGVGDKFTCQELYEIFDEQSDPSGPYIGYTSCRIAQSWAEQECGCAGAPIAPLPVAENPSCDLCGDPGLTVPADKKELLLPNNDIATRAALPYSWIECGFMEIVAKQNGLTPEMCGALTTRFAFPCGCFDKEGSAQGSPSTPSPTPVPTPAPTPWPVAATTYTTCALGKDGDPCNGPSGCCSDVCDMDYTTLPNIRKCVGSNVPYSSGGTSGSETRTGGQGGAGSGYDCAGGAANCGGRNLRGST